MTTFTDLMPLVKIGMEVWDIRVGKGAIVDIKHRNGEEEPIHVLFENDRLISYDRYGRFTARDVEQSLRFSPPTIEGWRTPEYPRLFKKGQQIAAQNRETMARWETFTVEREDAEEVFSTDGIFYNKLNWIFNVIERKIVV